MRPTISGASLPFYRTDLEPTKNQEHKYTLGAVDTTEINQEVIKLCKISVVCYLSSQ